MNTTARDRRETRLPAGLSAAAVVEILHDHETLVRLNPLVISVEAIEAPSHATEECKQLPWKKVVDEISYLPAGLWKGSVEYEACFKDLPDGVIGTAWAPMGLVTSSTWTVVKSEGAEESLSLREDCETKCSFLIMPFVKKTQSDAHKTMISRILHKLEPGQK